LLKGYAIGKWVGGEQAEVVDEFEQQEIFSDDKDRDVLVRENENRRDILLREIERVTKIQVDRRYQRHQEKKDQKKKDGKPTEYLQALHLYFDRGMNQTEIAAELGLKEQYEVSRLLNLSKLCTDIVDGVFNGLRSESLISLDANENDDEFESIKKLIREYLDKKIVVKDRSQTVISQAICKYLQSRGQG
jgi:hypothetical protein